MSSEGELRNGKPDGYWKSYYRTGILKTEGTRINYLLEGAWKFYRDDGSLELIIRYTKGVKSGTMERWRDSILVSEEPYVQDKRHGQAKYYYTDGSIHRRIPFVEGRREGNGFVYDTTGVISSLLLYRSDALVQEMQINRTDRLGLKQGIWMTFYPDLQTKIDGPYKDDLRNGYWKYYTPRGELIRIEKWIMGVLQDDAEEVAKIEMRREFDPTKGYMTSLGSYRNGVKEGLHRQYNEEGEVIGGQLYRDGVLLAEGIYDELGRKQKTWKYYYEDGMLKAIGDYYNDRRTGNWQYFYDNGELEQEGRYLMDMPDGTWFWYFDDGSIRREQAFYEGLADGPFLEYNDSNRLIVEGQYADGLKEGKWKYHTHNVLETGEYVQDDKEGKWIRKWVDIDVVMFEGNFSRGKAEGTHVVYYPSGQIHRRGRYRDGLKNGIWEIYSENGARIVTIEYEDGVEIKYNGKRIDNER